jgi:hypothetical protein
MISKKLGLCLMSILLLVTVACLSSVLPAGKTSPNQGGSAVFQTVAAVQTREMVNTLIAELTRLALITPTPPLPTNTPIPTNTPVPPTDTPTLSPTETSTPIPTNTFTATSLPCYSIKFVGDTTVPENTVMSPGQTFTKTWRLQNTGSCAWAQDFTLELVGGLQMGAPSPLQINITVNPGQTVDLSLPLVAPSAAGAYAGYWKLRSSAGVLFGLGDRADIPLVVKIIVQVVNHKMDSAAPLDFAYNYCSAYWSSTIGNLPCPGVANDFINGSVTRTNTPRLESGYQDDEPAIILIPSNGVGGFISGRFPAIVIKNGDRFRAVIGCLDASPLCSVLFQLNYSADGGGLQSLGGWVETSDGAWTRLDVDLSSLAGKSVEFVFTLSNRNDVSTDDRFFIMAPYIKR